MIEVDRIKKDQKSKGFVVVCMDSGSPVLATHQLFDTEELAVKHAQSVHPSRLPVVFQLRERDWTVEEILAREG